MKGVVNHIFDDIGACLGGGLRVGHSMLHRDS